MNAPLLAIVGPTASGKTEMGLRLARQQNAEIISVDSRQVYKDLTVGTAKPRGDWAPANVGAEGKMTLYRVNDIPYHLVDFLDPDKSFSAADFVRLALEKIGDIRKRGKTPIFVGGTGLYYKALTEGLAALPPASPEVRARLKKEAEEKGRSVLHERLLKVDPSAAAKIPANNIQRLIRALEVHELTGKPISEWHKEHQRQTATGGRSVMEGGLSLTFLGIEVPRDELNRRIESRCRTMIADGMIEETRDVLEKGFSETCPALSGLGYPRIIALLKETLSPEDCLRLIIQDTRQYAKRQMTWFRHQLSVTWKK